MRLVRLQILWLVIIMSMILGCNSQTSFDLKLGTVYFKNFDLFRLQGIDTLKQIDTKQSVEVRFQNGFPVFIKYYKPERIVTLVIEDSFSTDKQKMIYVYTTSNFHGGAPGRHRVYSFHHEEYKDLLFISHSDTIVCKSYEITKLPDYYTYTLYLYIHSRKGDVLKYISGSDTEEDAGLTKQDLYYNWLRIFKDDDLKEDRKPEAMQHIPE